MPSNATHHGADDLPAVTLDSYNLELKDKEGFIGDRASKRAFAAILDDWRDRLKPLGDDPLGETETADVSKKRLDEMLTGDDAEAAGLVHGVVEDFAQELAAVIKRFTKAKGWQDTERIVVGGGLRQSRVGELAIGRATVLLKAGGIPITLVPIRNHPDEAGLLGATQLIPKFALTGHDGMLAVDIGGSNIRVGIVEMQMKKAADLSQARVARSELWRHADNSPNRKQAFERLVEMVTAQIDLAKKEKISLVPAIGIGCPGLIAIDGSIERGGQNLPGGNWESAGFNLPAEIAAAIPTIGDHETYVIMHNDAVVQGLSEVPFMSDVSRWGVVTIGTGLGNARFSNKAAAASAS